jgi:uncharacterized protein (UPF0335 family)
MTKELKELAVDKNASEHLKRYIEAIENYEAEKQEIAERIKEIFDEAKATGFDVKTMRQIIKLRKKSDTELQEEEYLLETYKEALGMDK